MGVDLEGLSPELRAQVEQELHIKEMLANREFGEAPKPNPLTMTVQRVPTAADMSKKRTETVSAVGRTHYIDGCQKPKTSPMGAASSDAAQKRYEVEMAKKETLARRQENLKKVTDSEWLGQVEATGADNLVKRTEATAYKYERFASKYEAELKRILATADGMPTTTLDERIAKSAFMQKELAKLKGKV